MSKYTKVSLDREDIHSDFRKNKFSATHGLYNIVIPYRQLNQLALSGYLGLMMKIRALFKKIFK